MCRCYTEPESHPYFHRMAEIFVRVRYAHSKTTTRTLKHGLVQQKETSLLQAQKVTKRVFPRQIPSANLTILP